MDHPYIFESVQPNRKKNIFYTLPDIIKNDADIRALIDVLDDNNELRLLSIGDISDPSYQNASADDMWVNTSALRPLPSAILLALCPPPFPLLLPSSALAPSSHPHVVHCPRISRPLCPCRR